MILESHNMLSEIQSGRVLGGRLFEDFVTLGFNKIGIDVYTLSTRVKLSETNLTFDCDGIVKGQNKNHIIEIKKSISDSTICKIYCQYQARLQTCQLHYRLAYIKVQLIF